LFTDLLGLALFGGFPHQATRSCITPAGLHGIARTLFRAICANIFASCLARALFTALLGLALFGGFPDKAARGRISFTGLHGIARALFRALCARCWALAAANTLVADLTGSTGLGLAPDKAARGRISLTGLHGIAGALFRVLCARRWTLAATNAFVTDFTGSTGLWFTPD
jgi:hypothetical protein